MAMYIMHCLTVKLCTVLRWSRATRRQGPVVALAIVEMMIDVAVEMFRPLVPRASPDEYTASEPLRPIIAVWSAVIRRGLVVPVWANGRFSDADRHLCTRFISGSK
jgi:hypothetical protein